MNENASGDGGAANGAAGEESASNGALVPRFLVDGTAGKLARWLRVLGFDVAYTGECEAAAIARLARQSDRTVLTRSGEVAARLGGSSILANQANLW